MKQPIRPFAVLIKALLLFLVINLAFAWINPSPASFTLINHILPGFERFPINRNLFIKPDGAIGFENNAITDLDILFSTHVISGEPKETGEYRVVLLGDSSTWGFGVSPDQTLSGVINHAELRTCNNKLIRAYSLAWPSNSALKDLLIMARSIAYEPDMFIWLYSLQAFVPDRQSTLADSNPTDYRELVQHYQLDSSFQPDDSLSKPVFWDRTIWGQRLKLGTQIQVQGFAISRYFFGSDDISPEILEAEGIVIKPPGDDDLFSGKSETNNLFRNQWLRPFDTLRVANQIAAERPLLLVNEPTLIETGKNSDIRYNWIYPRWAFDQYRDFMRYLTSKNNWIYYDFWDLLPKSEYFDSVFHRTALGNQQLADELIPLIQEYSCK